MAIVSIVLAAVALVVLMVIRLSAPSYDLTIASTAGGSVTTPGEAGPYTYDEGTVVNLVAEAEEGYHFANWTDNVSTITDVNAAKTTITMNGDYSITANFEAIPAGQYSLTITSTAGGSVTTPGEGTFIYDEGTVVDLVAEADAGYHFDNWTGNVGTIANVNDAATTITMNGDYSITANFEAIPAGQYSLTIASTAGGSVTTPGEGTFIYDEGTVVDLVAEANEGYLFDEWTGNVGTIANVNAAATTITMNDDYSIMANFWAIPAAQYSLTIASTSGGSVTTPGEGNFIYDEGTVVDLVAEADAGYQFVNWTGDVGTIANVNTAATTITMNGDYSITANFVYELNISSTAGGSVTNPGEGTFTYAEGTVVNLVAEANEGCLFGEWTGDVETIADVNAAATTITMNDDYFITAKFQYTPMVAAGRYHTVGLKSNSTVVAVGDINYGQCDVGSWTDITQVSAGAWHTVGLKSDGTVVAVGYTGRGRCNVGGWTDIVQVAAGDAHTVGLKSDGTVVAVGDNDDGQCEIGGWTDITQVAAGGHHTVGLKSDGTVVAVGDNDDGQCEIGGWTDITQVAAGAWHTVGLKSDGTVVAMGENDYGQCDVGGWMIPVHKLQPRITQVAAGDAHTVGLKSDGTVVAVGASSFGRRDVGGWDLDE